MLRDFDGRCRAECDGPHLEDLTVLEVGESESVRAVDSETITDNDREQLSKR